MQEDRSSLKVPDWKGTTSQRNLGVRARMGEQSFASGLVSFGAKKRQETRVASCSGAAPSWAPHGGLEGLRTRISGSGRRREVGSLMGLKFRYYAPPKKCVGWIIGNSRSLDKSCSNTWVNLTLRFEELLKDSGVEVRVLSSSPDCVPTKYVTVEGRRTSLDTLFLSSKAITRDVAESLLLCKELTERSP